jgi:hypothetical protein
MNTTDKMVAKVAKAFVAYAKAQMKKQDNTVRLCLNNITRVCGAENGLRFYVVGSNTPINLPDMERGELARFTAAVSKEIIARLKLGKAWFHDEIEYTVSEGGWMSRSEYHGVKSLVLVKPCKEFHTLLRKLTALGTIINWREWRHDSVFGKRSQYSVSDTVYAATQQKPCSKVLEFLKGCRKAEVTVSRRENLGDMEYGIRYETEWSGSIDHLLKVSAKGKTCQFYAY